MYLYNRDFTSRLLSTIVNKCCPDWKKLTFAVRETNFSRHNRSPIVPSNRTTLWWSEGFQETLNWAPVISSNANLSLLFFHSGIVRIASGWIWNFILCICLFSHCIWNLTFYLCLFSHCCFYIEMLKWKFSLNNIHRIWLPSGNEIRNCIQSIDMTNKNTILVRYNAASCNIFIFTYSIYYQHSAFS